MICNILKIIIPSSIKNNKNINLSYINKYNHFLNFFHILSVEIVKILIKNYLHLSIHYSIPNNYIKIKNNSSNPQSNNLKQFNNLDVGLLLLIIFYPAFITI